MTPEERANKLVRDMSGFFSYDFDYNTVEQAEARAMVATAIREAVAEERERIANVADVLMATYESQGGYRRFDEVVRRMITPSSAPATAPPS